MAQQLAKINEAHEALSNALMGITENHFCLILLHALPSSYELLASKREITPISHAITVTKRDISS